MHPISEVLRPVLGHPSWLVERGHGSFITMEYGEPLVEVREPRLMPLFIEGAPAKAIQRYVFVGGEWHLWVYCCEWSLLLENVQLAHNESDDVTMHRALHMLNGQILKGVDIEPADGRTRFTFDLGCSLLTYPAPSGLYGDKPVEQWTLHARSGPFLAIREDGKYWIGDRHQKPADKSWLPIATPIRIHQ